MNHIISFHHVKKMNGSKPGGAKFADQKLQRAEASRKPQIC